MRFPRSLTWRLAIPVAVLVIVSFAVLGALLVGAVGDAYQGQIIAATALGAAIAAALSAGLIHLLAGPASRSVRAVTQGLNRLSEGDTDQHVGAAASDETEKLVEAFNKAASASRELMEASSGERETLSPILETMTDGVIVVDSYGRTVTMNRSAKALLGVRNEEYLGGQLAETVRDHELSDLVSRTLESGTMQQFEVDLHRQRRLVNAIATPLSGAGGEAVLLTLRDLTAMRQLDVTRREFVSNVSHELRSPLASIKALADTLLDGALEEPEIARGFVERINGDVDRMTTLVNDLLELSRLESGHAHVHLSPVELRPLVEEARANIRRVADGQEISVETSLPEDLPLVVAEADKVRQVLSNLLENAVRASLDGGTVSIGARAKDRTVEVAVRDTGIGISAEHLPHVFERFYKVDRARRDGGTGLGLAIVKHIIQTHGGEVSAASEEAGGSTFTFTLPRAS